MTSAWKLLYRSVASGIVGSIPSRSAYCPSALCAYKASACQSSQATQTGRGVYLLSRGKHGPPYPQPGLRYFCPMRESHPTAFRMANLSAPGVRSAMSPIMFLHTATRQALQTRQTHRGKEVIRKTDLGRNEAVDGQFAYLRTDMTVSDCITPHPVLSTAYDAGDMRQICGALSHVVRYICSNRSPMAADPSPIRTCARCQS